MTVQVLPAYEAGMSKLKIELTSELTVPKYLVPAAVLGDFLLTGTIRWGYCQFPVRYMGQVELAAAAEEALVEDPTEAADADALDGTTGTETVATVTTETTGLDEADEAAPVEVAGLDWAGEL